MQVRERNEYTKTSNLNRNERFVTYSFLRWHFFFNRPKRVYTKTSELHKRKHSRLVYPFLSSSLILITRIHKREQKSKVSFCK